MLVRPVGMVVTLSGCRVLLAPDIASRELRYNFLLYFWLYCHVFVPLWVLLVLPVCSVR